MHDEQTASGRPDLAIDLEDDCVDVDEPEPLEDWLTGASREALIERIREWARRDQQLAEGLERACEFLVPRLG
ncbi:MULTISPECIES: hypothetical protein [Burkholderiaceae]|uniref:hypothetical protein n=1 Tax=Burkholderiaceae TaxID=119060 RepID=UPI00041543CD|nr:MULTISPECIES: hypothetical protein [Burkholderiaceae]